MEPKTALLEAHLREFGIPAKFFVRAPGRVNLIGEHTDYNDGFVMPLAIDRAVRIALSPRNDGRVVLKSLDLNQAAEFNLGHFENTSGGWIEYVKGTAWSLIRERFSLSGWQGVVTGDVPMGAGLSSSAALELAAARAFSAAGGFAWDAPLMARLGQRAENEWIGVRCGIMDQMIAACGEADRALLLDCRSLESELVPLPTETAVAILDTATRRGLVDSAYNERRAQCEQAARYFGVEKLRDATSTMLAKALRRPTTEGGLDAVTLRRARHVISENERVLAAAGAMRRGDAAALGELMNASHASLRNDYEVSSPALDAIVDCARQHSSCIGARMTGAGFGGCAVALVDAAMCDEFTRAVGASYQKATGLEPQIYACRASQGASVEAM